MTQNRTCPFCNHENLNILIEHKSVYAIYDSFPVTEKHCLVIPKAHKKDYFSLSAEEKKDSFELLEILRENQMSDDSSITGFNIGINCGESAGQTVFHCHIHLIPRRDNDTKNPRGGVRGVIAEKQKY